MKNIILNVAVTAVLIIVIIFELNVTVNLHSKHMVKKTNDIYEAAKAAVASDLKIDKVSPVQEMIPPISNGDVIEASGLRVKLNGFALEYSQGDSISVRYEDQYSDVHTFFCDKGDQPFNEFIQAYDRYFNGDQSMLAKFLPDEYEDDKLDYMKQTTVLGIIPVIQDSASSVYYMFVPGNSDYTVLHCDQQFTLTDSMITSTFDEASDDPMVHHVFSDREIEAIINTRNELTAGL